MTTYRLPAMTPIQAEVQRALAQKALVFEHYFLNGTITCDWTPGVRKCIVCIWHCLDVVTPL